MGQPRHPPSFATIFGNGSSGLALRTPAALKPAAPTSGPLRGFQRLWFKWGSGEDILFKGHGSITSSVLDASKQWKGQIERTPAVRPLIKLNVT